MASKSGIPGQARDDVGEWGNDGSHPKPALLAISPRVRPTARPLDAAALSPYVQGTGRNNRGSEW